MNVPGFARELWKSVRIVYTDEWWLFPAVLVVAIGYPLWVGATGAAVTTIAEFVGLSLTVDPWTGRTTALAVVLAMFWVVAPAAVATQLVLNRLTNAHGNLRTCYRLRRPLALFGLPVLLVVCGLVVTAVTGGSAAGEAILVVGALLVAIRGTAYAYRVFALSLPLLAEAILFLAVAGLSITILAAGALGAGRHELVADTAAGIAGVVGVPALTNYADGTVVLGGVEISMVAATVVVTAILPVGAYVGIQLAVSGIQRLRKPDVKRSSLRTGQRYPGFAHPTAGGGGATSGGGGRATTGDGGGARSGDSGRTTTGGERGSSADAAAGRQAADTPERGGAGAGATSAGGSGTRAENAAATDESQSVGAGAAAGGAGDDDVDTPADGDERDDVSHTRVYSPPEDAEDIEVADGAEAARRSGTGKFCPSCEESYEGETRTFCPTCGARLEES